MIDLFCGIGSNLLCFELIGHVKSVFSSEIDRPAVKTYKSNFREMPYGDINLIDEKSISEHYILVGCFPCQAFSIAGKKLKFKDTMGTLFFDIVQKLK